MIIGISGKIGAGKDTVGKIIQYLTNCKQNDSRIGTLEHFNLFCNLTTYGQEWNKDWQIKKFAYKLKQCVSIITGIPIEDLEKEEVKNRLLGEEWNNTKFIPGLGLTEDKTVDFVLTIRQLLQQLGTEVGREIHPNFWINALFIDYTPKICSGVVHCALAGKYNISCWECPEYPNWVITDVRFPNEVKAIKDKGGIVIRVDKITDNMLIDNDTRAIINYQHKSETALDNATFDYTVSAKQGDIESLIQQTKEILIKEKLLCLNENKN
ncbi:MAG TPA: hypothetical protein PLC53_03285 [Bacilli bacterium]|nr:hypothetical protein [Bacilli bacterium]